MNEHRLLPFYLSVKVNWNSKFDPKSILFYSEVELLHVPNWQHLGSSHANSKFKLGLSKILSYVW